MLRIVIWHLFFRDLSQSLFLKSICIKTKNYLNWIPIGDKIKLASQSTIPYSFHCSINVLVIGRFVVMFGSFLKIRHCFSLKLSDLTFAKSRISQNPNILVPLPEGLQYYQDHWKNTGFRKFRIAKSTRGILIS